jgi:outer membrane receptor protein involved in Fe transport
MVDRGARRRSRAKLLCSAGTALVFGLGVPGTAFAQDAAAAQNTNAGPPAAAPATEQAPAPDSSAAPAAQDRSTIFVTGTRVIRNGYKAPTPTTVLGTEEIAAKAPTNLADFVNELPQLASTNTPKSNISFVSAGLVGINALNLRNLGENRTLVLLDGQRVGPSTLTGFVDVNIFPQALVNRVDIVTGGASASWGSDAVAGVVNFILDKNFKGLKGEVQGGVTTYGDDRSYKLTLTGGTGFADDRGHFLISGEMAHNDGVHFIGNRSWYNGAKIIDNPDYTPTNGQPQFISRPHVGYTATPGGLIVSGPLAGTYFGAGGTPGQLPEGPISGFLYMQDGGAWPYNDIGTSGDLDPKLSRQSIFTRVSYDITSRIQLFAQGSFGRAVSHDTAITYINYFLVNPDNAFIPASIAPQVTEPFLLGTVPPDIPVTATTKRNTWRFVVGANGDLDLLGSKWTWDAYWQKSVNRSYAATHIPINANIANATDAVFDANGVIVCRSTLTNPNDGCVPFNLFGERVNSQLALDYVTGLAWGVNRLKQDVGAATLHGQPFSTWAGPVSLAAGVEHRREAVSGSNDPLSTTNSYWAGNYHASFGSYHVTEGFLETVVPLAKDLTFAKSLELNAAVRATNYSTSGYVTTWKVGATYSPVSDITFRATRSRDIRAPNLSELFQAGLTQSEIVSDPDPNSPNPSPTIFVIASGNRNLKPEKADSLGLGVVVQPRFIPGFEASVDYYHIKIGDAIATTDAQTEINQCFAGVTAFCPNVTRNAAGAITSVDVSPVNFAKQIASGLDFEASYRHPLFAGEFGLRGLATRFLKNFYDDGISPPFDTVGTNGYSVFLKNSLPKWRYLATLFWNKDPVALSLTARGFSAGVQNTSYIQCSSGCPTSTAAHQTIDKNGLPGAIYFDTNITVKLPLHAEAYLAVDNIFNKDPAQVAYGPGLAVAPISVNPVLYDVLGRTFRLGLRFRM